MNCFVITIFLTYNSRHAGPASISSISMNVQHLVLIRFFFGLKCLNSKNIAVPRNNRYFYLIDSVSPNGQNVISLNG